MSPYLAHHWMCVPGPPVQQCEGEGGAGGGAEGGSAPAPRLCQTVHETSCVTVYRPGGAGDGETKHLGRTSCQAC